MLRVRPLFIVDRSESCALIRPEAVDVHTAVDGPWTVAVATFRGATVRLTLERDGHDELVADVAAHRAAELPAGATVRASLQARPVLLSA